MQPFYKMFQKSFLELSWVSDTETTQIPIWNPSPEPIL